MWYKNRLQVHEAVKNVVFVVDVAGTNSDIKFKNTLDKNITIAQREAVSFDECFIISNC